MLMGFVKFPRRDNDAVIEGQGEERLFCKL